MEVISQIVARCAVENEYLETHSHVRLDGGDSFIVSLCDDKDNVYGYFECSKAVAPAGNVRYVIKQGILDDRLDDVNIAIFVYKMLLELLGIDVDRVDWIYTRMDHALCWYCLNDTYTLVAKEVLIAFHAYKDGIEYFEEYMEMLRQIGEKMKKMFGGVNNE